MLGSDPSVILGSLSANGKVFLINPNGVLFGRGAQVNVGGLVASTLGISDADFMAGRYTFSGTSRARRAQPGHDHRRPRRLCRPARRQRRQSGRDLGQARHGRAGRRRAITLDVAGDGLLNVAVDKGAVNALVRMAG